MLLPLLFGGLLLVVGCSTLDVVDSSKRDSPRASGVASGAGSERLSAMASETASKAVHVVKTRSRGRASELDRFREQLRAVRMAREHVRESERSKIRSLTRIKLKPPEVSISTQDETTEEQVSQVVADSEHSAMHWYRLGLASYFQKRPDDAIAHFQKFLSENPDHVYSDRAAFWIAESYFQAKEFGLGILMANQMQVKFPHSVRLPELIYHRALAHLELNQKDLAIPELRGLLETFPRAEIAVEASRKLAVLSVKRGTQTFTE